MDRKDEPDEPWSLLDGEPEAVDGSPAERPGRLRAARSAVQDRARRWDVRRTDFVPVSEQVVIDARRHPVLLVAPSLRTVAGLVLLATGPLLVPLTAFLALTGLWALLRLHPGLRRAGVIAASAAAAVVVSDLVAGPLPAVLGLLAWLVEDVADWYSDRLVVTDKRIYRRHGVVTRHSPSISLTAIAYIDASVPPVGRLLRYGTLRLDSVAQRDAPLSRFDLIPDVVPVSHEILRLRSSALPKFPPLPH